MASGVPPLRTVSAETLRLLLPREESHVGSWTVYLVTFTACACSYATRKCFSTVRVSSSGLGLLFLSQMDAVFMLSFAAGSFAVATSSSSSSSSKSLLHSGVTAVWMGLLASGAATLSLSLLLSLAWGGGTNHASVAVRASCLVASALHGLAQSATVPNAAAVMGKWFDPGGGSVAGGGRGNFSSVWMLWHQPVGHVASALVATAVLTNVKLPWTLAMAILGVCSVLWGVVCVMALPADANVPETDDGPPVPATSSSLTLLESLRIRNVLVYVAAFALFKFIFFTLLLWLPYFLAHVHGEAGGDMLSVAFDAGMMCSGVVVSLTLDLNGGRRACAVASFLVLLPMALVIFAFTAESLSVVCTAGLLAVLGCLVASPSNILTSAVALELSEQPAVRGNAAALHWLTIMVNGLGTVGASLGLLIVGPLQTVLNWHIIILGLAVCSVGSNMLLAPPLFRELRELYGREPKATPSPRI